VLEIVRKKDRLRFPDSADGKQAAHYFESLHFPVPDSALHSYLAEFEPTEAEHIKLHQHPEIEFPYVLSGRMELRTAEDTHELADGHAIYFDCTVPHGYRKLDFRSSLAPTRNLVLRCARKLAVPSNDSRVTSYRQAIFPVALAHTTARDPGLAPHRRARQTYLRVSSLQ
jgi:mannose-6-phosphate isomerase-like protein (cupin superfamily)